MASSLNTTPPTPSYSSTNPATSLARTGPITTTPLSLSPPPPPTTAPFPSSTMPVQAQPRPPAQPPCSSVKRRYSAPKAAGGAHTPARGATPPRRRPQSARLKQDWDRVFRTARQPAVNMSLFRYSKRAWPAHLSVETPSATFCDSGAFIPDARLHIPVNKDCDMCSYVKEELDGFDRRVHLKKALSLTEEHIIEYPTRTAKLPAVVSAIHEQALRVNSVLVVRLLSCDRAVLKESFLKKMRANGSIGKQEFLVLLRTATGGESVADSKEILSLFDSLERNHRSVDFVTFFAFLESCEMDTPAREKLNDSWGVMSREKVQQGIVFLFEWEAMLSSVDDKLLTQAIAETVRNASCGLYTQGWCSFVQLLRLVESSDLLSSIFLKEQRSQRHQHLRQTLKERLARNIGK